MYDRYGDISKFITDEEQLCVADGGYVYISEEKDYDIAVDMESCYGSFDEVKSFIVFLSKHICELDNLVQRFNQKKRIKEFPFELSIIYVEEPNSIVFDYWCTTPNTQLDVTFEFKENRFFLRKYGLFDCIPDNWEEIE